MGFSDLLGWIALALGALIAGSFLAYGLLRWRLVRRITSALGPGKTVLSSAARLSPLAAVDGHEHSSQESIKGSGLIMLVAGGLYFHSWLGDRELFVAGPSITYIGVPNGGQGRRRSRGPMTLRYLNNEGKEEGTKIRLLYPEQWAEAIRSHLIGRNG